MDKLIENLLTEFVTKAAEKFNLSFEDALAAVSQTKVANDLVAFGKPEDITTEELYYRFFDEISKGY